MKAQAGYRSFVSAESPLGRAIENVVESHESFSVAGGRLLTIAAECADRERRVATRESRRRLQIGKGPELGDPGGVTGERCLGVGRDGDDADGCLVVGDLRGWLGEVPEANRAVIAPGRELRQLGMKGHGL